MKISISVFVASLVLLTCVSCAPKLGPSCKNAKQKELSLPEFSNKHGQSWGFPQQLGTSWCWASTAQNVMRFYGKSIEQCDVVAKVVNDPKGGCCDETPTTCWNMSGHPELAFDKFGFSYLPAKIDTNQLLTWTEATEELCEGRPFISSIDLTLGARHSVVVTGYSVKHGVRIYDPALDDLTYESLSDFFNNESPDYIRVRDTWFIKPKTP